MTYAAAPRLQGPISASRPQWMRTAHRHLQVYVYLWIWLWVICVVGAVVAMVVIDQVDTVNVSILQFVRDGPLPWFVFAIAILVGSAFLTPHVANGMTRRSFVIGGLLAAALGSLLHALTGVALISLEGVLYDQLGWVQGTLAGEGPGFWERGLGALVLDHTVITLAGSLSGLLVGITYYRLGGWWATLALPLTVLPVLGLQLVTTWGGDHLPLRVWEPAGIAIAVVVLLASAIAFALLTRGVPIGRTES